MLLVDLVKAFGTVPRDVLRSARQVWRATSPGQLLVRVRVQRYQANEHGPPGELRPQRRARGSVVRLTSCALHTHAHLTPQHWLLCQLGWYWFEFKPALRG